MGASRSTAFVLRHIDFEDLGNLEPCLRDDGYAIGYLEAGLDPTDGATRDANLLVVLGGPIGTYEAEAYPFRRDELAHRWKILLWLRNPGICLNRCDLKLSHYTLLKLALASA